MNIQEFAGFIRKHREQHPSARLPAFEAAPSMYGAWLKVLIRRGAADAQALDDASTRMLTEPPGKLADHFVTLCTFAEQATKARGGQAPRDLSTREGAEAASKKCDRGCGGTGFTTVWHPAPDPTRRIAATSAAYCVCALGRWIERNHAAKHPETRKRIPDLADVIAGRDIWLDSPPGLEDAGDETAARYFAGYREALTDSMTQEYREGRGVWSCFRRMREFGKIG